MDLKFKIGTTEAVGKEPIENGSVVFDKSGKIYYDDSTGRKIVGEKNIAADKDYDADSENAQSGKAVAQAVESVKLTAGTGINISNNVISATNSGSGGSGVGQVTVTGADYGQADYTNVKGEIFNDYDDNKALAPGSHAEGTRSVEIEQNGIQINTTTIPNIAGCKCFQIKSNSAPISGQTIYYYPTININNKTITINGDAREYNQNDVVSIITNQNFDECAIIDSINYDSTKKTTTITLKSWPEGLEQGGSSILNTGDWVKSVTPMTLRVPAKPLVGDMYIGLGAHTEGVGSQALADGAHAEGRETKAVGRYAHTEGRETKAQYAGHAEGEKTFAGFKAHAEGYNTNATGKYAHSEGSLTEAQGESAHAEGQNTFAFGEKSHTEGSNTTANGLAAHAEGSITKAIGNGAHAEGYGTNGIFVMAEGTGAHAEGIRTESKGSGSHSEGADTSATGSRSHTEGNKTYAPGFAAHAEGSGNGDNTSAQKQTDYGAFGNYSHSEGNKTKAIGIASHAEGEGTIAQNHYSHAEGRYNIYNNLFVQLWNNDFKSDVGYYINHSYKIQPDIRYSAIEYNQGSNNNTIKLLSNPIVNIDTENTTEDTEQNGVKLQTNHIYKIILSCMDATPGIRIDLFYGTTIKEGKTPISNVNELLNNFDGGTSHRDIELKFVYTGTNNCNLFIRPTYTGESNFVFYDIEVQEEISLLHSIGNGTSDEERSNAFAVYQDGHAEVQTVGDTDNSIITKQYLNNVIGDIEAVLDSIITAQESYIGGDA